MLQQYEGDLEKYLLDLGDATRITAVISHNFNAVELLGLRELMVNFDYKRIREYEKGWRANHRIAEGAPSTIFSEERIPYARSTQTKAVRILSKVS